MSVGEAGGPLPDGWRWARLREVASFFHGGTPSKAQPEFWNGDIPWVSPKDMRCARIYAAEDTITAAGVSASATRVVEPGTILIVARSGILARALPTAVADTAVAFNQDIKAIVPSEQLDAEFAAYALRARESYILREGVKKGATVHSLKSGFIEGLELPLPPLPEQRRIADLLDAAMAQQARARAATLSVVERLRGYRERLVVNLLRENDWPERSIAECILEFRNGFGRRPHGVEQGPIVLRIADVSSGRIDLSSPRRVAMSNDEKLTFSLGLQDVLFIRVNGSLGLVGRCIPPADAAEETVSFNDHLMRGRVAADVSPAYLTLVAIYRSRECKLFNRP